MSLLNRLRSLAVLLVLLTSGAALADTAQTAFVEDPSGTLTVEQAAALEFKPFTGPLSLGNRNVPTWIRVTVPPLGADAKPRVLLVEPALLNDVQIFSSQGERWQMNRQGNRYAYSAQGRDTLNVSLPITPSADTATTYYLRVQSLTAWARPRVVTQNENRMHDANLHVGVGIYCGFALVFLLISLVAWASTQATVWGASALFDLVSLLHVPIYMGFAAKFVFRESAELIPTLYLISSPLHMFTGCLFFTQLLKVMEVPRWLQSGYVLAATVSAGLVLMTLIGKTAPVLLAVNLTLLLLTFWGAMVALFIRTADPLLRWSSRILYIGLTFYFIYTLLPILGFGRAGALMLYPTMPSHFFTMAMTVLILGRRTWLNAQARHTLELEAREASRRFEQEQTRHAETAGFLGMLMHEIKNPLTSIRVASEMLSSGRVSAPDEQQRRYQGIQNAVDGINTVLQRCLDLDRLERGAMTVEKTSEDIAALTRLWVTQHPQTARLRAEIPDTKIVPVDVPLYVLMLSNLVDNALKYSPADSIVELHWRNGGERVAIEVRNAVGRAGLPDPKKLFEKYYRSPMAQRNAGTGLGLYWVHRVCQMLGGEVSYREENGTAVFTLSLPTTP